MITKRITVLMLTLLISGCAVLYGNIPVEEQENLASVPIHYPHGDLGCVQIYSHAPLLAFVASQPDDRSAKLSLYSPNTGVLLLVHGSYPAYVAVGPHDCQVELPDDPLHSSRELPFTYIIIDNDDLRAFLKRLASHTSPLSVDDRQRLDALLSDPNGAKFSAVENNVLDGNKIAVLSVSEAATVNKVRKYLKLSKHFSEPGESSSYQGGYHQLWLDFEKLDQSSAHLPLD